jgi:hypothetical protein
VIFVVVVFFGFGGFRLFLHIGSNPLEFLIAFEGFSRPPRCP